MAMDEMWRRYERQQLEPSREFETQHPEVVALTKVEEIHVWEDWACRELGLGQ